MYEFAQIITVSVLIGAITFLAFSVLFGISDWWQKKNEKKKYQEKGKVVEPSIALCRSKLNLLCYCNKCKKYSRRHHQERALLYAKLNGEKVELKSVRPVEFFDFNNWETRVCPHCLSNLHLEESKDRWPWLDTHNDCFKIDDEGCRLHQQTVIDIKDAIFEMESIEAFKRYNGFEVKE